MTRLAWKAVVGDLLDGVERELRPSVPLKAKITLNAFRKRLCDGSAARRPKRFERELEAFLQSEPHLGAATKRFLNKRVIAETGELAKVLECAVVVLSKKQGDKVRARQPRLSR